MNLAEQLEKVKKEYPAVIDYFNDLLYESYCEGLHDAGKPRKPAFDDNDEWARLET